MLMIDKYLKKPSIMSKEDQELFISILPEPYKNNVMYYLNNGYCHDAIITIYLSAINGSTILGRELTDRDKASLERTSQYTKEHMTEKVINQLNEFAKKYNLDTFIECKSINKEEDNIIKKKVNINKINGETIKTKYSRGQKLEKEINENKIQYEIRGMCINIRDEQLAKDITDEQIEILYNIYQDDLWVATINEKELERSFKIL